MAQGSYLTREKLLSKPKASYIWVLFFLGGLLIADLALLNYHVLFKNSGQEPIFAPQGGGEIVIASQSASQNEYLCDDNCQEQINSLIASSVSKQVQNQSVSQASVSPLSQEYYIPLGAGTVNSTSWTTVAGLQANIDSSAYGNISTVTFEVTVSVPTGNQYVNVQLYNQTLNHPVWFSSVQFNGGGTAQLLVSSPITLDAGTNTYVVQAQTQLPFQANIEQARVHIISN